MRPTLYGDFERPASVEPEGAGHQPTGEAAPHALVGGHGLVVALPSPGRVGPGDLPEGVLHIAGRTEPGGGLDQGGETGGEALEAGGRLDLGLDRVGAACPPGRDGRADV